MPREQQQKEPKQTKQQQNLKTRNAPRGNFQTQKSKQGLVKQVVYWGCLFSYIKALQVALTLIHMFSEQLVQYVTLRCNRNYYASKETELLCAKLPCHYLFKATC